MSLSWKKYSNERNCLQNKLAIQKCGIYFLKETRRNFLKFLKTIGNDFERKYHWDSNDNTAQRWILFGGLGTWYRSETVKPMSYQDLYEQVITIPWLSRGFF